MLVDLLQSGIEDINSLEKPYIFAEVGRMAAEESSLMKTFWRAARAASIQGFFILKVRAHRGPTAADTCHTPQPQNKNHFGIFGKRCLIFSQLFFYK